MSTWRRMLFVVLSGLLLLLLVVVLYFRPVVVRHHGEILDERGIDKGDVFQVHYLLLIDDGSVLLFESTKLHMWKLRRRSVTRSLAFMDTRIIPETYLSVEHAIFLNDAEKVNRVVPHWDGGNVVFFDPMDFAKQKLVFRCQSSRGSPEDNSRD